MSRTLTVSDENYAQLESQAHSRGFKTIEELLNRFQTLDSDALSSTGIVVQVEGPLLLLYIQDEETEADSGFGNELVWTIRLTPSVVTSLASTTDPIFLTRTEIIRLAELGKLDAQTRLFAKFGMTNLNVRDGYPKGPYFSVDENVYEEIVRLAKTAQAGRKWMLVMKELD